MALLCGVARIAREKPQQNTPLVILCAGAPHDVQSSEHSGLNALAAAASAMCDPAAPTAPVPMRRTAAELAQQYQDFMGEPI